MTRERLHKKMTVRFTPGDIVLASEQRSVFQYHTLFARVARVLKLYVLEAKIRALHPALRPNRKLQLSAKSIK